MADENDNEIERDDDTLGDDSDRGDEGVSGDDGYGASGSLGSDQEARQIAREEEALAEGSDLELAPITSMLGIERWVQFSFVGMALVTFFVLDQLGNFILDQAALTFPTTAISGAAVVIALLGAFTAYRHPRTHGLTTEVVGELAKVTWPTRDETYASTVVVIVTSVVAALYTGIFDALWSAFTDLVYNV